MGNYSLTPSEGIILQYDGVYHNRRHSELVLTNQNLICVEANSGIFKTTYNTLKFPINQIKIINGQVQASVIKDEDGWTLQILFKNGTETFQFSGGIKKKREADKWVEQIRLLMTGGPAENPAETALMGGVKHILGSIGIGVKEKKPAPVTVRCMGCMAPLTGQQGQRVYCKYCDTEQILERKA